MCYGLFAIILWLLSLAPLAKSELTWQQPSKPAQGLVSALKDNNSAFSSSAKCLAQVSQAHFPAANGASSADHSSQGGGRRVSPSHSAPAHPQHPGLTKSMDFPSASHEALPFLWPNRVSGGFVLGTRTPERVK